MAASPFHHNGYSPSKVKYSKPQMSKPAIIIQEMITIKEIQDGNIDKRIIKILEHLADSVANKTDHESKCISLRMTIKYVENETSTKTNEVDTEENNEDIDAVVEELNKALKKSLERKQKNALDFPEKLKRLREVKAKINDVIGIVDTTIISAELSENVMAIWKSGKIETSTKLEDQIVTKKCKKQKKNKHDLSATSAAEEKSNSLAADILDTSVSAKKSKKHKKNKNDSFNNTLGNETTLNLETQHTEIVTDLPIDLPKRSKRKHSLQSEILQVIDETTKTPKNKKKQKLSESTNGTPNVETNMSNSVTKKSSKKKHKQLEESIPLTE